MSEMLRKTADFITLYRYHVGESEVPPQFHLWSCISMLAASVANRVWIEKFRGKKLYPNLYTVLLGPSGLGKGEAIQTAAAFIAHHPEVNIYAGELTAPYLLGYIGTPVRPDDQQVVNNGKSVIYLIAEELAMSVGEGINAHDLVRHLTGLYSGAPYPTRKGTVTRDAVVIRDHLINFLAGSTADWLIEAVPRSAIKGGWGGRNIIVEAEYPDVRYRRPIYPGDYEEVRQYLASRITRIVKLQGAFTMDAQAIELEEQWYATRPRPEDEDLWPAWKRGHDLMLKLAMVFSLSRNERLLIDRTDVIRAQQMTAQALAAAATLMNLAMTTDKTVGLAWVQERLEAVRVIPHSAFLRKAASRGIHADEFRQIMRTLVERQEVRIETTTNDRGPTGIVYHWMGRQPPPREALEDGDGERAEGVEPDPAAEG